MSTTFGSFEEFWAALNRLYESTLKHDEAITQIDARLDRLASMLATLAVKVTELTDTVEKHERRLERMEEHGAL